MSIFFAKYRVAVVTENISGSWPLFHNSSVRKKLPRSTNPSIHNIDMAPIN